MGLLITKLQSQYQQPQQQQKQLFNEDCHDRRKAKAVAEEVIHKNSVLRGLLESGRAVLLSSEKLPHDFPHIRLRLLINRADLHRMISSSSFCSGSAPASQKKLKASSFSSFHPAYGLRVVPEFSPVSVIY